MNWISNYVRPKINAIFSKKDTPDNLWQKCPNCGMMLFHREVKDALCVCNGCGHHMLIPPKERLLNLFDGGIYSRIDYEDVIEDPLNFKDRNITNGDNADIYKPVCLVTPDEVIIKPRISKNLKLLI